MLVGVLTALGVLGAIGLLVVLFLQRGREGMDLSLGGLLRLYLYLASLAGVIAFAIGLAGLISYVLAAAFGLNVIYGGQPNQPSPAQPAFPIVSCPPGAVCPSPVFGPVPTPVQIPDPRVRQQTEDLVRGVTFVIFGGIFWAAHWWARRTLAAAVDRSGLHRAYLILGTAIFGIATIALLPMGIYQALSFAIVPPDQFSFRPGAGEALSGGLAALPLWLAYLWLVQRALRTAPPSSPAAA